MIMRGEHVRKLFGVIGFSLLLSYSVYGQSTSFKTYVNPVIPGDHPDCTVTRIGDDFYTAGSSFNPTPVIYHSTDLVHWEAVAQPVSAAWAGYGDAPAGGCWGGQVVYRNGKYWYFFARIGDAMYFTTADDIQGPWSNPPTQMNSPAVGYDNSIFIDDDGSWYLLVKNGQPINWIVQLGDNGQPNGVVYDLAWLNPAPSFPYSFAEGPVMWKYKGYYYYCFGRNVGGGQYVYRSAVLTDDQNSWIDLGNFFNESDPLASQALFRNPNHSSAVVMLDDSTHWVVHPLWRSANNNEWYGQGRQGLLNQVRYAVNNKPTADYPVNIQWNAPKLPSSGIPWMVPHSDFFDSEKLNPEWSFLGYTPANTHSLTQRSGWLTLSPKPGKANTIIKNDGEHSYSLVTKVDFSPESVTHQAGLWIFNGLETKFAKLYGTVDSSGGKIVAFSYQGISYKVDSPVDSGETVVLLKLVRDNHALTGYCSGDGSDWIQVGSSIDVTDLDGFQQDYNAWTGNRQGLFVQGKSADFDYYIYRDAYTTISTITPTNLYSRTGLYAMEDIRVREWALYAGVEFGNSEYAKEPDSLLISASSFSEGGVVEVWLDSVDTGTKLAECTITNTGSWDTFETFSASVDVPVSDNHDVYLKFNGTSSDKLFELEWFMFTGKPRTTTSVRDGAPDEHPRRFELAQNYPNPFNPSTNIKFRIAKFGLVQLKVFDLLGRQITTLVNRELEPREHEIQWDATGFPSGIYFYRLTADGFVESKKLILLK